MIRFEGLPICVVLTVGALFSLSLVTLVLAFVTWLRDRRRSSFLPPRGPAALPAQPPPPPDLPIFAPTAYEPTRPHVGDVRFAPDLRDWSSDADTVPLPRKPPPEAASTVDLTPDDLRDAQRDLGKAIGTFPKAAAVPREFRLPTRSEIERKK